MITSGRFSFGMGDRFAHQGHAQLSAVVEAARLGIEITPVWNKSFREHQIIHTDPATVRKEADEAVRAAGWQGAYFTDADHITSNSVDLFIDSSDFFTLDVADFIGQTVGNDDMAIFAASHAQLIGTLEIPRINRPLKITEEALRRAAGRYLLAVRKAGALYRHIEEKKGAGNFVTEVSMDETDLPQSPQELLIILAAIADEGIPAQTIAPKFTGRFNKGVDYVGSLAQFEREFADDIAILAYASEKFGLPANIKLSVHSGSDKFSIYPIINRILAASGAGLHLKTAGTTWLEELIGLAEAGEAGAALVKEIYRSSFNRYDELTGPYAAVIDIDTGLLPDPDMFDRWSGPKIISAVRHDLSNPDYSPHIRQLLHVGYKTAAEMGSRFTDALAANQIVIGKNVRENLLERHIKPLFRLEKGV